MCVGVEVISLSLSLSQVNNRVQSYPRRPAMSNNGIFQLIMKCMRTRGLIIIKYLTMCEVKLYFHEWFDPQFRALFMLCMWYGKWSCERTCQEGMGERKPTWRTWPFFKFVECEYVWHILQIGTPKECPMAPFETSHLS